MNGLRGIAVVFLFPVCIGGLLCLFFLHPSSAPFRLEEQELLHYQKQLTAVREKEHPDQQHRHGKLLVLDCGVVSSNPELEVAIYVGPLDSSLLARSRQEVGTIVFLERHPKKENNGWYYIGFLARPDGQACGRFRCEPAEVPTLLKALPEKLE